MRVLKLVKGVLKNSVIVMNFAFIFWFSFEIEKYKKCNVANFIAKGDDIKKVTLIFRFTR
jgi:hypothetical protein